MAGSFLLFVPDKMRLLESRNAAECVHILEAEFRIAFATARYTPMSSRGIPCMRMFSNLISRCKVPSCFLPSTRFCRLHWLLTARLEAQVLAEE